VPLRALIALAAVVMAVLVTALALADHWRSTAAVLGAGPGEEPVATGEASPAPATATTRRVELKRGDTFVVALAREGISHSIGNAIAAVLAQSGANLRRLRPRDTIAVTLGPDGDPLEVTWAPSPWLGYVAVSIDGTWEARLIETEPDVRVKPVQGRITRSLFQAIEDAGSAPRVVVDFVRIFEFELDFTADTRPGDQFRMLLEKRYAGDELVDYGRILVGQYRTAGRLLTGVGFEHDGKFAYYDLDGRSLRKMFLKAPLEFTRITSGFTYARPHPILGGTRPHLGIDYAAPTGTPVRAVADGVVLRAGWAGGNGISVTLRHRRGYETMYNHLSRLGKGIRPGVRVSQRQVIGYVGSTGLSTGPHLDYRVRKDGRFVNPLSEKFLPGEPLPAAARAGFREHAQTLLDRLEREAVF
jgi:murein DD-endopeptidase MepM/ murein hydrolase activator NlpD